jgi:phospholipase C
MTRSPIHPRLLMSVAALGVMVLPLMAGVQADGATTSSRSAIGSTTSPIKHVVVIYQENHSFDDVLGQVCRQRAVRCNGYTGPVTFADGVTAANVVEPDLVPAMAHSPTVAKLALANEWDRISGCKTAPYACVTHIDPAKMPNLTALADKFVVSDATFAAGQTVSFGAHLNLASGTLDGFAGYNPQPSTTGHPLGPGWGCNSYRDAPWRASGTTTLVPSCIPDQAGAGPYRTSPVPYVPTIMQRLEHAGLTWHAYIDAPSGKYVPSNGTWSICTYFAWCLDNRFSLSYNSPKSDFFATVGAGKLANVTFMLPVQAYSQHNGASMAVGDNYIGDVVRALEASSVWGSTAIFITYDDCGCFYDHVKPPSGLGMRNPMVIVSPYAKPVYTDSTTAIQPYSVLSFIDHNFGLAPITPAVGNAYDYADSFDFTQRPLHGITMTHRTISRAEKEQINKLAPRYADDPT